jgi:hypothetical protein
MREGVMKHNRLYYELAHLWPWVSDRADYAEEAEHWRRALRDGLGPGRHRILELGVGGGHSLNPEVELHVGDMRTVRLNRTFDAVLVHDAIAYMRSEQDLRAAFTTAAAHLRPYSLFITTPDFVKETYRDGACFQSQIAHDGIQLTLVEYEYDTDPGDTEITALLLCIIRQGSDVRVEEDWHTLGLFPKQTWIDLMTSCGFDVEVRDIRQSQVAGQHHMFVGTKRP